jgi:hypothetical protein
MNLWRGGAFIALLPMSMPDRDHSDRRPVDRFFLLAIVAYALVALAFIAYFVRRLFAAG